MAPKPDRGTPEAKDGGKGRGREGREKTRKNRMGEKEQKEKMGER